MYIQISGDSEDRWCHQGTMTNSRTGVWWRRGGLTVPCTGKFHCNWRFIVGQFRKIIGTQWRISIYFVWLPIGTVTHKDTEKYWQWAVGRGESWCGNNKPQQLLPAEFVYGSWGIQAEQNSSGTSKKEISQPSREFQQQLSPVLPQRRVANLSAAMDSGLAHGRFTVAQRMYEWDHKSN